MSIFSFLDNPVRSTILSLVEALINNIDTALGKKAVAFFELSDEDHQIIQNISKRIKHISIIVEDDEKLFVVKLQLKSKKEEILLSANYKKIDTGRETIIQFVNLKPSKKEVNELLRYLTDSSDYQLQKDLCFRTDEFPGDVLNKLL